MSRPEKDLLATQTHSGDSLRPPVAPLPLMPGQVLLDKYEVERVLGVGGMGVVVSAMHLELGERVAIKAMLTEMAASRDHATRFAREAQAPVGDAPIVLQFFVERPGTTGNAASTFDDFSR